MQVPLCTTMLRYLIKTLLQMNLFTDTIRNPSNGTDVYFNGSLQSFNGSLPPFNSSLFEWGNFTGFNGKCIFPSLTPHLQPPQNTHGILEQDT